MIRVGCSFTVWYLHTNTSCATFVKTLEYGRTSQELDVKHLACDSVVEEPPGWGAVGWQLLRASAVLVWGHPSGNAAERKKAFSLAGMLNP